MSIEEETYLQIANKIPDIVASKMFGKPCLKTKGKAFVCFFENSLAIKLKGDSHSEALSLDGSELFDPSKKGRPMKEWVQVSFHYSNRWKEFAEAAKSYVSSL